MDLLQNSDNYGSSSEDEHDDDNNNIEIDGTNDKLLTKLPSVQVTKATDNFGSVSNNNHYNSNSSSTTTNTTNDIGKRIVSLASVLPPHILRALTKQQQRRRQGRDEDEDEDDESDDENDDHDNDDVDTNFVNTNDTNTPPVPLTRAKTTKETKNSRTNTAPSHTGSGPTSNSTNPIISSFLHDLHQVGFQNMNSTTSTMEMEIPSPSTISNTNSNNIQNDASLKNYNDSVTASTTSSKLGSAFLPSATTTTTIRRKATMVPIVRNVHDDNDTNDNDKLDIVAAAKDDDKDSCDDVSVTIEKAGTIRAMTDSNNLINPSRFILHRKVQAAPQVTMTDLNHTTSHTLQHEKEIKQQEQKDTDIDNEQEDDDMQKEQQLSRKEIERVLRRNDFTTTSNTENVIDQIGNNITQSIDGVDPTLYAPNVVLAAERYHQQHNSDGIKPIRPITTQIYDPTLGATVPFHQSNDNTTTTDTATKGKNKNQIHTLVTQAMKLQRERNEQQQQNILFQQGGNNVGGTQNSHRVNAKRKYGW